MKSKVACRFMQAPVTTVRVRTIELSRHAMEHGATGLMVMPPYLLRPPKQDVLDHFRRIREAVPLPIMIYNVPALSGVKYPRRILQRSPRKTSSIP